MFEFFSSCECPYCEEYNTGITVCYNMAMEPITTTHHCDDCGKEFRVTPDQVGEVESSSEKMPKKKKAL